MDRLSEAMANTPEPPKPVCIIKIAMFENLEVVATIGPTLQPHVVKMMLDTAKERLLDVIEKKMASASPIQVAPPGLRVERNGG